MRGVFILGVAVCAGVAARAQWLNYPSPGAPGKGKVNLSASAPRAANGKPDLSGVWQIEPPQAGEIAKVLPGVDFAPSAVQGDDPRQFSKYFFNLFADLKPGEEPLRLEAAERLRKQRSQGPAVNTESRCLPMGMPRVMLITAPFRMIQAPAETVILYEGDNTHRQVFTDGRRLGADPDPSWLGYSTGSWVNGALVVETAGLNDKVLLDAAGHTRSEKTHMTERYRRRDFGHMEVEVTIDDPVNYTRPFSFQVTTRLLTDTEVLEAFCTENEQDFQHLR